MTSFRHEAVTHLIARAILIVALPASTWAATFDVKDTRDLVDANPGDTLCRTAVNTCTLRAAIQEANALAGPDTINLEAKTYRLTIETLENGYPKGGLEITDSVMINGAGRQSIIDGGLCTQSDIKTMNCNAQKLPGPERIKRVFLISKSGTNPRPLVHITGVTIRNGGAKTEQFVRNQDGGGIHVAEGTHVILIRSVVTRNIVIGAPRGGGAGISNHGLLEIIESRITDNETNFGVGTGFGGGIQNTGEIDIYRSEISKNKSSRGGGIYNSGKNGQVAMLTIINSTVSGNHASGPDQPYLRTGGAIHNSNGVARIAFSTIADNAAHSPAGLAGKGGGIFNETVPGAAASSFVALESTIVASNRDRRPGFSPAVPSSADCFSEAPSRFVSYRGNVLGVLNSNCNISDTDFDQVGTVDLPLDPKLYLLDASGTHALMTDSPAIDGGYDCTIVSVPGATPNDSEVDQRGFPRPIGTEKCDSGSYESGLKADLDGDGDVDLDDLKIVLDSLRGLPGEDRCGLARCDIDGDDFLTALDARKLVTLCTRPRCATN